jgi:hypothetical protein
MSINEDKIEDLFSYHPTTSNFQERINDHNKCNEICQKFAIEISRLIQSEDELKNIINTVAILRMTINQAIVYKYMNLSIDDIFKD